MNLKLKIEFVALLVLTLLFVNCASFSGNNLPIVENFPFKDNIVPKPSLYVDANMQMKIKGEVKDSPNKKVKEIIENAVIPVVKNSNLFGEVVTDPKFSGEKDYKLEVKFTLYSDPLSQISAFITGFSMFCIPGYGVDQHTLVATLYDRDNNVLKKYTINESVKTIMHIFLLPVSVTKMNTMIVAKSVRENMVKYLLTEIKKDNLISLKND